MKTALSCTQNAITGFFFLLFFCSFLSFFLPFFFSPPFSFSPSLFFFSPLLLFSLQNHRGGQLPPAPPPPVAPPVTQHDFDRLYFFYPGFIFIKLDIPGNLVYLPFDWCLICSDCFTKACVGWVNWGQCQKGRVAKLIGFYGKWVLCQVLCFPFVSVCTRTHCARAHSLYRNPPKQNIMLNFK